MGEPEERNDTEDGAAANARSMAGNGNKGRLELTWSNKNRALLSREDGSYEWVPKRDHRVAEVRLLRDAGTVGDVHADDERANDNLLIRGDALNGLTALAKSPEFAEEYAGKVKLAYIDPPFNTGQAFEHYDDGLEHSVWLTMMRDRLMQIKELLAPDGSVWVHLDDVEMAYCRVLMDEILGRDNFVSVVAWEKVYAPRMDALQFSSDHDYLIIYSRNIDWRPNRVGTAANPKSFGKVDGQGRRYRLRSLRKEGSNSRREDRRNLWFAIDDPDGNPVWPIRGDGSEGCWRWDRDHVTRDYELIDWVEKDGALSPYLRQYEEPDKGRPPQTLWRHADVGHNHGAKEHLKQLFPDGPAFGTPKPESLLKRVIHIGSDPGDLVLDCFAGSGTTAAVAHKMGRRWVTMELSESTIDVFTAPRLEKVVKGDDPGGITESVEWQGGGGFRVLDVAPSIFEDDEGVVVLADWVTDHDLGQAVAAQLGFEYEPEQPFCGRQGKLRLAVIDGHVDKAAVQLLVQSLEKGEKLSLCATSLDPAAAEALKKISRGSQARVVPQDILLSYRTPSTWQASVARGGGGE